MQIIAARPEAPSTILTDLGAIFVSLELSRSTWLITSLSPGGGEKMSKDSVPAGDICALLARVSELRQRAFARTGKYLVSFAMSVRTTPMIAISFAAHLQ